MEVRQKGQGPQQVGPQQAGARSPGAPQLVVLLLDKGDERLHNAHDCGQLVFVAVAVTGRGRGVETASLALA